MEAWRQDYDHVRPRRALDSLTPQGYRRHGLSPASGDDWDEIEYTYDSSGSRIAKDVDVTVIQYV